jgi:hypothetical protein
MRGGFFLRKKPLGSNSFEVLQLWNRCVARKARRIKAPENKFGELAAINRSWQVGK